MRTKKRGAKRRSLRANEERSNDYYASSLRPSFVVANPLHQHSINRFELGEEKGGTKGFDAEKANQELEDEAKMYDAKRKRERAESGASSGGGDGEDSKKEEGGDDDKKEDGEGGDTDDVKMSA